MSLSLNALRGPSDSRRRHSARAVVPLVVAAAALALVAGCAKSAPGSAGEHPSAFTQSAIHRSLGSSQSALNARIGSPSEAIKLGVAPSRASLPALLAGESPQESGGCPAGMASVNGRFCVDRYEGSIVEVTATGETRPHPYYLGVEGLQVRALSVPGVKPQGHISARQAADACKASGKRLCKPQEWRTACMGPEKSTWGYGAQKEDHRCNDHGRSPIGVVFPHAGRPNWGWNQLNDEKLNQVEGTLAETGAHPGCTNGYGVFDMVGNLHEWVDDPAGTFQGGYYQDTHINGDGCGYRTTAHNAVYHDYSTGFRCCADPTP